jgi:cobyrinic acid a,c-diamide synthase
MTAGLVIAAPSSGSGKTVVTLALLRALRRAGHKVASLKVGPDYIDPGFHRVASGGACRSFDPWAMRPATLTRERAAAESDADLVLAEGVTGLFDGAADGIGSTADAAVRLGWPVVLVIDVRGMGASAAALAQGFDRYRADTRIAGVIFNRVGSPRHAEMLRRAMRPTRIPVFGIIPRDGALDLPERHLGLVEASALPDTEARIEAAADAVSDAVDIAALAALAAPGRPEVTRAGEDDEIPPPLPPLGQRIAVAADAAFGFAYPHVLDGWRESGASVTPFSPLADEAPPADADAVYLPGGYPELHAGRIAGNAAFLSGLRDAAGRGAVVYGECGGFMVLGQGLVDADGARHEMAGLLPVETSFAARRLHLGYRRLTLAADTKFGLTGAPYNGHEFHYSTELSAPAAEPLFNVADALGVVLPQAGCRAGSVMGSYIHLIDWAG